MTAVEVPFREGDLHLSRFLRWHREVHQAPPHGCKWSEAECDPARLTAWVYDRIGVPMPDSDNGAKEYLTDIEWDEGLLSAWTVDTAVLTPEGDDCVRHSYFVPITDMPPAWPWGMP